MKNKISNAIDDAINSANNWLIIIQDFKKNLMRQFLGIDCRAAAADLYKTGFSSGKYRCVRLHEIVQPDGIAAGPDDKKFFSGLLSESGYPLIVPAHIKSLRYKPENIRYVSKEPVQNHQQFIIKGGDIILSYKSGDIGASALVPFMQEDSFLGAGLLRIRLNNSLCEVFFILNSLHFYYHTDILNMVSAENGGLNTDTISNLLIALPPLENQKEIADRMLRLSAGMEAQEHYHNEMQKLSLLINNL